MPPTPSLNFLILSVTLGAFLLAAVYHGLLYLHRREEKLLRHYTLYFSVITVYLLFRAIWWRDQASYFPPWGSFPLDEALQMATFGVYIHFVCKVMGLKRSQRVVWAFWRLTPWVLGVHVLTQSYIEMVMNGVDEVVPGRLIVRAWLLLFGFAALVELMQRRRSIYHRYLAAGAATLIFFGIISTVARYIQPTEDHEALSPLSWLMFGYFADAVAFSAAIGYRIKQESGERIRALETVARQNKRLREKEVEKLQAIYATREEERMRMAQDLHDDIGATLSGVALFSQLAQDRLEPHMMLGGQSETAQYLAHISRHSKEAVEKMSDIIWATKSENDSFERLLSRLRAYAAPLCSAQGIELRICEIGDQPLPHLTDIRRRKSVYLVLKEAMSNSIKYCGGSQLTVSVTTVDEGRTRITVTDNGRGFRPGEVTGIGGNGLHHMGTRAAEIGAQLSIQSSIGSGTEITLLL